MKNNIKILLLFFLITSSLNYSQTIRPIRDTVGFCWTAGEMDSVISFLEKDAKNSEVFPSKNLVAAISPHDDYLYAGRIYYPLFKLVKTKEVVIFGVTHGTVRRAMNNPKNILILDDFDYWRGPYGNAAVSPLRKLIKKELSKDDFIISNKAQSIEHSIEALIPFLQYYNRSIKITPIMITEMSYYKMREISGALSKIIAAYMRKNKLQPGKDMFFLISNDANHYGKDFDNLPYGLDKKAHDEAVQRDKHIAGSHFNCEITESDINDLRDQIWSSAKSKKIVPLWCGRYPVVFGLLTTEKIIKSLTEKKIEGKLFKYSDTITEGILPVKGTSLGLTAPYSYEHWVGFFSAGFYIK